MKWVLGPAARLVERKPWWAIGAIGTLTVLLALFAVQQQTDTDITAFAPDSEIGRAFTHLEQDLGASDAVQVIIDSRDGNVVSAAGIQTVLEIRQALEGNPEIVSALAPASTSMSPISSFVSPIIEGLEVAGIDPATATSDQIAAAATTGYSADDAALALALISRDADVTEPSARAGMVLVRFRPGLTNAEMTETSLAVKATVEGIGDREMDVEVFSLEVIYDEMQQAMNREITPLLGLALLLVVTVLIFFYRRMSDVVVGIIGLLCSIVWMYGIGVLMGPGYLGWVGAFTQISVAVPVLLVGLGIDYAVHLTSRYREERSLGTAPPHAAGTAVLTVGGALALATVATLIGFLTNLASPIPPIGDFGVFAAVGVLSAFVVMALLIPAVRNVLDRRKARGDRRPPRDPLRPITRLMKATTVLATRIPLATLGFGLGVTVISIVVASGLTSEFSQDEFVPEGSEAERLITVVGELFGGDVVEETGVVITGNLFDPGVANAMLETEANMADTPDVRLSASGPRSLSPASALLLAREVASEADPTAGGRFEELGLLEAGLAGDADVIGLLLLASEYVPVELGSVVASDGSVAAIRVSTMAGEERTEALAAALLEDAAPLIAAGAEVTVTSRNLLVAEVSTTLTAAQQRSIIVTLGAALVLLVGYYAVTERRPVLGVVTMIPSLLVVAWTLGTMRLMGLSFNVLTGTVASLAIGIGVPYGIHVTHRFTEDLKRFDNAAEAVRTTVGHTGAALAGAALTTAAGFGVLWFSSIVPLKQFGAMAAITIIYSLAASVLAQPSCLVLWDRVSRWQQKRKR